MPAIRGTSMTSWASRSVPDSLVVDFDYVREVGGVVLDWDSTQFAEAYDVSVSDDGTRWSTVYSVGRGKPGRAYIPCNEAEGRYPETVCPESPLAESKQSSAGWKSRVRHSPLLPTHCTGPSLARPPGDSIRSTFLDQQSYWTVTWSER